MRIIVYHRHLQMAGCCQCFEAQRCEWCEAEWCEAEWCEWCWECDERAWRL